jgi:enoyl-CoA hydratase
MNVRSEVYRAVARIVLDRPLKKNAVDANMARSLHAAFDRFESDTALRVCLLAAEYGEGRAHCTLTHFRGKFV